MKKNELNNNDLGHSDMLKETLHRNNVPFSEHLEKNAYRLEIKYVDETDEVDEKNEEDLNKQRSRYMKGHT